MRWTWDQKTSTTTGSSSLGSIRTRFETESLILGVVSLFVPLNMCNTVILLHSRAVSVLGLKVVFAFTTQIPSEKKRRRFQPLICEIWIKTTTIATTTTTRVGFKPTVCRFKFYFWTDRLSVQILFFKAPPSFCNFAKPNRLIIWNMISDPNKNCTI